jgi:hypothetical protein
LIAEDFERDDRIVAASGVSWFTIEYWKKPPYATARIQEAEGAAARMALITNVLGDHAAGNGAERGLSSNLHNEAGCANAAAGEG